MIVTRTRVGDHICKMSELFYYFSNCWSGYQCTFSRDPLQRSNMFSNDKTVINNGHIVYCTHQTSSWKKTAEPVKIWSCDSNCMRRLQICVFAGSSFSMTGKYSDHAAQEYLSFLLMKRNFAGAVSSSTKVSGECFHVVCLRKLIWIYSFLAAGNFTGQNIRHSLMNNGNSDQTVRVLAVWLMAKTNANYVRMRRFNFDSACAGLSLSPLLS